MKPVEVQRLRAMLQLSQEDFAKRLNVNRRTVIRWESGQTEVGAVYEKLLRGLRG